MLLQHDAGSCHVHKVVPSAAISPRPSFKVQKGHTKVSVKLIQYLKVGKIPTELQYDTNNF